MRTIILAGGYATRLWPLTQGRPILSADPFEHLAEIENMQVEMTFVGGELVYSHGR